MRASISAVRTSLDVETSRGAIRSRPASCSSASSVTSEA